ncbi:MAG: two-component system response regulator [Desulfuromonas sp.]|nr:MAG: two-component system response regulator [Desulfuromonas sp.]
MTDLSYQHLTILIVDDEASWQRALGMAIERHLGINIVACHDSREAMAVLANVEIDLAILDITMPYLSGDDLLVQIKEVYPQLPVIVTTGLVQIELAVKCMKLGAFDYYVKTTEVDRILNGIKKALELARLQQENQQLRDRFLQDQIDHEEIFAGIRSRSKKMRAVFQYIEAVADGSEPVLVLGESGSGKELIAKAIHQIGRPQGPWVAVNVAGLDDNVFSDTLFGHVKGAFTGADQERSGMIEQASGGILFLDEIGDLSQASQVKLLRLLQEGEYYPLGSDRPKEHAARFVFATNRNLEEMQKSGAFRTDLYYRLSSYRVVLPPLRERPEDISMLVEKFSREAAASQNKDVPSVDPQLIPFLQRYSFPGNARELRALVFEAVSLHKSGPLGLKSFKKSIPSDQLVAPGISEDLPENVRYPAKLPTLKESANLLVDEAMRRADGNQTRAAKLLGISRPALSKRLKNS